MSILMAIQKPPAVGLFYHLFTAHSAGLPQAGRMALVGQVGGFPHGAFPPTWLKLPPDNLDISFSGSDILSVVELTLALSSPCFHQEEVGMQSQFWDLSWEVFMDMTEFRFNHVSNTVCILSSLSFHVPELPTYHLCSHLSTLYLVTVWACGFHVQRDPVHF